MAAIVVALFVAEPSTVATQPLDLSVRQELAYETAKTRYIRGSASAVFGGLAIWSGARVITDENASTTERMIGTAVVAIGSLRLLDGIQNILRETEFERDLSSYEEDAGVVLRRGAERQHNLRIFRASLLGARSLGAFSLAVLDFGEYWFQLIVGLATGGVAIMQAIRNSPAENAWEEFRESGRTNFTVQPQLSVSSDSGTLGLSLSF